MKRFLGICLALALLLCGCRGQEQPSPSPSPDPAPVLAFFGASNQPWCQPLLDRAAQWCDREGWELVEYDCLALSSTQQTQVDDLLRSGGADLAVLCDLGSPEELESRTAALARRGVGVITCAPSPGQPPQGALCHLAPTQEELWNAAIAYFRWEEDDPRVLILKDSAEDPLEGSARAALESARILVAEELYTWGDVDYARQFLADALTRHSGANGVLCFSRGGALGARGALEETGRADGVRVLCLDDSRALREMVERGELDGIVMLNARAEAEGLEKALTQAARGETPDSVSLGLELWEGETE